MTDRISLTLGDRQVHWDLEPGVSALFAQYLVQSLGPAEEGL